MKSVTYFLILFAFCFRAQAQQPEIPDTQLAPVADTLLTAGLYDEEYTFNDPVWEEATAEGGLNFRVFGHYARDDEHYRNLAERFERADSTLLGSDFFTLYYGYAYRDEYDGGYGGPRLIWNALIKEKNYAEAYDAVIAALKKAPATPNYLDDALELAYILERPDEEIYNLQWRMYMLLGWIHVMGDGSEEYPWPVINVSDEYTMMYNLLDVKQFNGQALVTTNDGVTCDLMTIEPVDNEFFTGSEVWFDISFPFPMLATPHYWANKLVGKEDPEQDPPMKTKKEKKAKRRKSE